MKVVYVSNDVKQMDIANELEVYHDMIDCRCIDIVTRKIGKEWYDIVCDDEGVLAGLTDEDVENIIKHSGYYYIDGEKQWCIVNMSF